MNKIMRVILIVLFSVLMIYFGFKRENKLLCFENYRPVFIERFSGQTTTNYKDELQDVGSFHLSEKLQSVILFSFIFCMLTASILWLLSDSLWIFKSIIFLYTIYMFLSFILIAISRAGVPYHLSIGLAHYIEDFFVSPYIVLAGGLSIRFLSKKMEKQ